MTDLNSKSVDHRGLEFYFAMSMTGTYTNFMLLPGIFFLAQKITINRKNFYLYIPIHFLATIVFSFSQEIIMYIIRSNLFRVLDWGQYNLENLFPLPKEYYNDIAEYCFWYAALKMYELIKRNHEEKIKKRELEEKLTKAQLYALQLQLHPHFLFNTLNMISSVMYEDPKSADKMIMRLSDLLRMTLSGKDYQEHTLKKELEIINSYVGIMHERFKGKLNVALNIDDETLDSLLPGFILQPIVENSIKYCLQKNDTDKMTEISIISKKLDNKILLTVKDNGPGIKDKVDYGIGLSTTSERLETLYGSGHRFYFENVNSGGCMVSMEIPYKTQK